MFPGVSTQSRASRALPVKNNRSLDLEFLTGSGIRSLVLALCAAGLVSCSHKTMTTPQDTQTSMTEGSTPAVSLEEMAPSAKKEILSSLSDSSVGIERTIGTDGSVTYELTSASPLGETDSFPVGSPNRLVIDLKSTSLVPSSLAVSGDNNVSAIRVGKRGDGSRIVFDLASSAADSADVTKSETGNSILVTFSQGAAWNPELSKTSEPTLEAVPATKTSMSDAVAPTALSALTFEKTPNDAGRVVIGLNNNPKLMLKQLGQTEYQLTLKDTSLAGEIVSPQIAQPGTIKGLRVVRATQSGQDVVLRMFVDAGTALKTLPTESGILVSALPPTSTAVVKDEARAQLAEPEAAKSGDDTAKVVESDDETARRNPTGVPSADGSKAYTGRLISLDLQETDIDNALRIIAEVSNLNIIASDDVTGKVTLRLIDVPWDQALDVILKTNGLDQVTEGNVIRIAPVDKLRQEREALREAKKAAENLEDLKVKYLRISYARATDLKEQVEAVISERGSVTVDERTNQLIIKDIAKGQEETLQLVKKLDLRTPQVLLETQIVEASRNLLRDLGFQWNFSYSMSPQTGNATGANFPNTVVAGGGVASGSGLQAINFPAAVSNSAGAGIAAILDSADGSRALAFRLTALEQEGKVRVLSRPQVATVNNKEAEIKSVETVRVRLPDSGLAVATGQGANASGAGASAFQEINVGITLRVTPQASPDYFVLLDVHAESSTFSGSITDQIPNTLEREATSTILVKSGQTFALGGVYRLNDRDAIDGLPFFKDIPIVGALFRRTFMEKRDEELIFFITPHIVEGSFDPSLM